MKFTKKQREFRYVKLPSFFKELSDEMKEEMIVKDSRYGNVVCRCETITEGEIVASMHTLIPAKTLDGVKRRTNTGMGRCQGGFCSPKIVNLLMKELNLNYDEVLQDRDGSQILVGETKEGK